MRYLLIFLLLISLGYETLPVTLAATVSGETRTIEKSRLSPDDMRRNTLEEKIRDLKLTIASLDTSIIYVQKKLAIAKKAKVNITPYVKKIQSLTQDKKKQKKTLLALEKKLIDMK